MVLREKFPDGPVVRTQRFHCRGPSSIPGRGTKILQATQCSQINEEETGNLPEKEFRVVIVKMIQNLKNRMEAQIEKIQEMFNKDLEELKNKQRRTTH